MLVSVSLSLLMGWLHFATLGSIFALFVPYKVCTLAKAGQESSNIRSQHVKFLFSGKSQSGIEVAGIELLVTLHP